MGRAGRTGIGLARPWPYPFFGRDASMDDPHFDVTPERLRAYAEMFEITVSDEDCKALAVSLAGGLAGLAATRAVDVEGVEPFVAFPIDRVRP